MWKGDQTKEVASTTHPTEFVAKLYRMLENPEYKGIVSWSRNKDSFLILNIAAFQEKIIPQEFSHSNFSSFVRQLNKYDFHKQRFQDTNSRVWEFKHRDFCLTNKDRPQMIKRKPPSSRNQAIQESVEELQGVLAEVQGRLEKLESENHNLYSIVNKQESMLSSLLERQGLAIAPSAAPHSSHQSVGGPPPMHQSHMMNLNTPLNTPAIACVAMIDENARGITASLLRESGCTVDTTESGVELVRMIEINHYKFVLLEPVLTSLDGLSTVTMIRRTDIGIPIIFCVNKDDEDVGSSEAFYRSRGVTDILWRPFTKQELYNTVSAYLA